MLTSLIENLKEVKDFRKSQGKRYSLWEVLLVVVLGVMSGHQGYREIDTQKERGHGREITRRVSVFKKSIKIESPWEHIQSIIQVERWGYRGKKPYRETVYYISSIWEKAEFFSQKFKGHWGIENQVHWVKDVLFKEDSMKIHQVQAATNWALLNTLGLNIFRGLGFWSITEGRRWLGNHWEKLVAIS
ncbi:hypothetical protein PL9631_660135 [Planktothrix paucivesiculata PCC 9631]|uniref:Transposase n=1 Tax=Planktothrix paucivesiculata PCC 9631 TaxID=671071 RepID=A0A7Z9E2J6_9CYAN|nr:ISAs1 family transposase [Planktothrix paucivesiculata]VXD22599.1 hypothetical protein PL9631_660135 [Planktothrix paucivesiculata PCC 9631]